MENKSVLTPEKETFIQFEHIKNKTFAICMETVRNDGCLLKYVPDKLKSHIICLTAVTNNGFALEHVPNNQLSYDVCLAAVNENPKSIMHVPDRYRSDRYIRKVYKESMRLESMYIEEGRYMRRSCTLY